MHFAPNIAESYPTKVFEYMAAGLPVVLSKFLIPDLLSPVGWAQLLSTPENTTEIADALTDSAGKPEKGRRQWAKPACKRFGRASIGRTRKSSLLALYRRIAPQAASLCKVGLSFQINPSNGR